VRSTSGTRQFFKPHPPADSLTLPLDHFDERQSRTVSLKTV
jgi:hypothetical protein